MTTNEAREALTDLRTAFGGFAMQPAEERQHPSVFLQCCTLERARQAIAEMVQVSNRRPSPNEMAQRIRIIRARNVVEQPSEPEPELDYDWDEKMRWCKSQIRTGGQQ